MVALKRAVGFESSIKKRCTCRLFAGLAGLRRLGLDAALLGQKDGLDVGQDTTLGDRDAVQQLVQLFVVADGQLQVTRNDPEMNRIK